MERREPVSNEGAETERGNSASVEEPRSRGLQVVESARSIVIDAGLITVQFDRDRFPEIARLEPLSGGAFHRIQWLLTDAQGRVRRCRALSSSVEQCQNGVVAIGSGTFEGMRPLRYSSRVEFSPGSGLVRMEFMLHNPGRARHAGGYWDLGDPGSVFFRGLSVSITGVGPRVGRVLYVATPQEVPRAWNDAEHIEVFQASSGGEAWNSRNHIDRHGNVKLPFRGFRLQIGAHEEQGLRACPILATKYGDHWIGVAVPEFWQQFPKAVECDRGTLTAHLFPPQAGELFELQSGEQKTHRICFGLAKSEFEVFNSLTTEITPATTLSGTAALGEFDQVSGLSVPGSALRPELQSFMQSAIEGSSSFFSKREVIDEYGWRHFGDLWADHEGEFYRGPQPVISHYNNQYDALQAFLLLFQKTGDDRWWSLADPLARHVIDIDIYHTDRDKSAYNGGLFWHTAHYHDAATATHRTMSRHMFPKGGGGGGPGNEHNYSTGLCLYHLLTGNTAAREAVIGLADWVIAMDDGPKHLLGAVCELPTGAASSTGESTYHGPGRGAGNSINVLLDAWMLTRDERYWQFAVTLIRRTIHPRDNIADRELLNAEMRWSYTVHLQTLFKFLDVSVAAGRKDDSYWYARESLLHYARWMADNEVFYLDQPEKLEFPTETWAAQELRKGNVLLMAALCSSNADERSRFCVRAEGIYTRAWNSLLSFETRNYTRPTILALQLGLTETVLRERLEKEGLPERTPRSFEPGLPATFVSQKQEIKRALSSPGSLMHMGCRLFRPAAWWRIMKHFWLTERVRQAIS